jgi:hypothetical protein
MLVDQVIFFLHNILINQTFLSHHIIFLLNTYLAVGFATTLLALEAAWHFTACKIKDKTIRPN